MFNDNNRNKGSNNFIFICVSNQLGTAECQPMRGCGNAACTLASIKQWERPICAEARLFVRIAPGDVIR
jgi:hypothetical protein